MGKARKIVHFGFNAAVELFETEPVQYGRKSLGIDNHLKNIAINEGLASLTSPMVGQFWNAIVILKKQYLKANKWNGYSRLSQSSFDSYLNSSIIDQSVQSTQQWQQCCGYPGIRLLIPRAKKVLISYKDQIKSAQKKTQLLDFQARVFLHQMDHIQCIDPLKQANKIEISQDHLKAKYDPKIQELFVHFVEYRDKMKQESIYHKSTEFNELRRQIAFTITDHYRKLAK